MNTLLTKGMLIVVLCTFSQLGHATPKIEYGGITVSSIGFDGVDPFLTKSYEDPKTLGFTIATELNNYFFTGVDYSQGATTFLLPQQPLPLASEALECCHVQSPRSQTTRSVENETASYKSTSTSIFVGAHYPIWESTDVFLKVNYTYYSSEAETNVENGSFTEKDEGFSNEVGFRTVMGPIIATVSYSELMARDISIFGHYERNAYKAAAQYQVTDKFAVNLGIFSQQTQRDSRWYNYSEKEQFPYLSFDYLF